MICKMNISEISEGLKSIIKNTANKLSGAERREYIGEIATELLNGNPRKAEGVFGWGRETVKTGMAELTTGIRCLNNYSARGNKKTEEKMPELADDIRSIVDPKNQADLKFQTSFLYTSSSETPYFRMRKIYRKQFYIGSNNFYSSIR